MFLIFSVFFFKFISRFRVSSCAMLINSVRLSVTLLYCVETTTLIVEIILSRSRRKLF